MESVCYTHYELKYFTAHTYTAQSHFVYHADCRPHFAAVHLEKGCVFMHCGTHETRAAAGDWIFIPRGISYDSVWSGEEIAYDTLDFLFEKKLIFMHIPEVTVSDLPPEHLTDVPVVFSGKNRVLELLLSQLKDDFNSENPARNILAAAQFYRLWHFLLTVLSDERGDVEIAKAVARIEQDPLRPFAVAELSRLCCMSESAFFKRFSAYTGTTPIRYRNAILAKMGDALLGGRSVAQVSDLLGLSPDYFTVLYKRQFGFAPSARKKDHT